MAPGWAAPCWPSEGAGWRRSRSRWRRSATPRARRSWPRADGKAHDDLRALAHGGEDLDAAVMEIDHPPHEGEADAGPVGLRRVVHLEDSLDVLGWNAHPGVRDGDPERLRLELGADV